MSNFLCDMVANEMRTRRIANFCERKSGKSRLNTYSKLAKMTTRSLNRRLGKTWLAPSLDYRFDRPRVTSPTSTSPTYRSLRPRLRSHFAHVFKSLRPLPPHSVFVSKIVRRTEFIEVDQLFPPLQDRSLWWNGRKSLKLSKHTFVETRFRS